LHYGNYMEIYSTNGHWISSIGKKEL